jgi:hypothetical protein
MVHWWRAEDHGSYAVIFKDALEFGYPKFGTIGIIGTLP